MKHLLSVLAFVLFIVLASYGQYVDVVTGVSNSNKEDLEVSGNKDFATKDYFSVNFLCVGTGSEIEIGRASCRERV